MNGARNGHEFEDERSAPVLGASDFGDQNCAGVVAYGRWERPQSCMISIADRVHPNKVCNPLLTMVFIQCVVRRLSSAES
jgi:hypothetical protein